MALTSNASAVWNGDLPSGSGNITLDSSKLATFSYNWKARSEGESGVSTPEELLAAAHAGCFAMAFANELASAGHTATRVSASAAVTFDISKGGITGSHLVVDAEVPGIAEDEFQQIAAAAKAGCPVSKALTGIEITLEAKLA
ncbi:OsmC family peroxiredoxin [Gryllotalpicola protaetiae]|uniref:OsmC family peroxiredoxin n=1 Tax=Gryllotalpicola protaetiae TaxID=2419771 RepID=A0A387BU35_9MICO|nr:OsmC family peroxiredoxin [Gryllotalpicola protaetiae]AYG04529.1 OsmC family peroxiredoxin [Gryllotalpicola protaetiae]